jgi:hypothetical protein
VRFSIDLVNAGLRFNEAIGFMGGEDIEFFGHAHKMGFIIKQTDRAIVREIVHPERLTLRAQIYRWYWCTVSDVYAWRSVRGGWYAATRRLYTVPINLILGPIEVILAPLFLVVGLIAFKRRVLHGFRKIARACARVAALVGVMPEPYRHVVGK